MTDSELVAEFLRKQGTTKLPTSKYVPGKELSKTGAEKFFDRRVRPHVFSVIRAGVVTTGK